MPDAVAHASHSWVAAEARNSSSGPAVQVSELHGRGHLPFDISAGRLLATATASRPVRSVCGCKVAKVLECHGLLKLELQFPEGDER